MIAAKYELTRMGPAVTPDDLRALEREIGAPLPDDYRSFLLACNGGVPEPPVGFLWEGAIRKINAFWALVPTPLHELRYFYWDLRDLNVDGFLPIAGTLLGHVCLAFDNDYGTVTLAERIYREELMVGVEMHAIANSFSEFLTSLVYLPLCPVVEMGSNGSPDDLTKYLAAGNSLDTLGEHNCTILCEAVRVRNIPMIEACIERGASLSKSIQFAVISCHIDLIPRLVEAGADVNEKNEYGDVPMSYVRGTGLPGIEGARNRELRDLLIKFGAHE